MAEPVRTCIGCRKRRPQAELVRFQVAEDGTVRPVVRPVRGRSAYLCPNARCFQRAVARRAFERALRRPVAGADDPRALVSAVLDVFGERVRILEASAPGHPEGRRLDEQMKALEESLRALG